jgi:hypothetical protein
VRRSKADDGYVPLDWSAKSALSRDEQEMVEIQRKDLWRKGIRTEPLLTQMALEFAACICMMKAAKKAGVIA